MVVWFQLGIFRSFFSVYQIVDPLDLKKKFLIINVSQKNVSVVSLYTHFRGLNFFLKGTIVLGVQGFSLPGYFVLGRRICQQQLCSMALMKDAKFQKKLIIRLKIIMRTLTNFDISNGKFQKFAFYPKKQIDELKSYRGFMCHGNEE